MHRSKNGPNGHALSTAISDARILPESLIRSLTMSGPKIGYILGHIMKSSSFLDGFLSEYFDVKPGKSFRKLSYFSDKEGKTRVIGILD